MVVKRAKELGLSPILTWLDRRKPPCLPLRKKFFFLRMAWLAARLGRYRPPDGKYEFFYVFSCSDKKGTNFIHGLSKCPHDARVFGCIIPQPAHMANKGNDFCPIHGHLTGSFCIQYTNYKAVMEKEYPTTGTKRGQAENG